MWLARVLKRLRTHPGPILLEGGEAYGAPYLIEELAKTQRVAWCELTPADAGDFIAINNRLADAVNRACNSTVLPHALPFSYSLEVLKKRLPVLGPLTVAVGNADYNPLFRDALLELAEVGAKVILITAGTAPACPKGLRLSQAELALTDEEAAALAGPYLSESERILLRRSSGGAYVPFSQSVYRLAGTPLPSIPSPRGDLTPLGEEHLVSPEALLELLLKLGRYGEALELAVLSLPERVGEFVEEAGQAFLAQGLLARLHLLLESLDEPYQQGEKLLEWRLVAAFSQNAYQPLLPIIDSYLQEHEAPTLRARYAGALPDLEERFAQAQRAAAAAPTPYTLFQLGRIHPDDKEGRKILRQSVNLAEQQGRPYDIARNAGALANSLIYQGKFQEAASWSSWALETFDKAGLKDGNGRLQLIDPYATSHLLIDKPEGLKEVLQEAKDALEQAELGIATDFRSILADLALLEGELDEALELATTNHRKCPRWNLGRFTVPLVRVLLEQGEVAEAITQAQRAHTLTAEEDAYYALPASLALGMAYSVTQPEEARTLLLDVLQGTMLEASLRLPAALYLLRLGALRLSDLEPELQETLSLLTPAAFRLFCGPAPDFAGVWEELISQHAKLQIRVLGREEVSLSGERLELSGRTLEVLLLLALYPQGLTPEALHAKLYNDEETKLVALRSAVSRLRTLIPISAYPQPYRITVPFELDVSACEAALDAGRLRQALEHYGGPLLGGSDAPGIREARETLEERLRQSVLREGDPALLLMLAETLGDDLELWQILHASLPASDARMPTVKAQLLRVGQAFNPHYN